jgi:Restriction endonuclease
MYYIVSDKSYIFRRHRFKNSHRESLFDIEILPGVWAKFGEPQSKLRSKNYHIIQLSISKKRYSEDEAWFFWKKFNITYVNRKKRNKKFPPIKKVLGRPDKLIRDGYIIISEPILSQRETFIFQNSYECWSNQLNTSSDICADAKIEKEALELLINKISVNPKILKDIPTKTDWRLFEELVGEIFRKFGYEVDLTKKTTDGGIDVIALRKDGAEIVERLLIECKHWKDKIDVKPVRNLIGVAVTQDIIPTGVILATTSSFTDPAKKLKINPNICIKLDLKDYNDILKWIGEYNAIELTIPEIKQYLKKSLTQHSTENLSLKAKIKPENLPMSDKYEVVTIEDFDLETLINMEKPSQRGKARIYCNTCQRHHNLHWGEFQNALKMSVKSLQDIIELYRVKYCKNRNRLDGLGAKNTLFSHRAIIVDEHNN